MLLKLAVHVLIVHPPDAMAVPLQFAVNDFSTVIGDGAGEAHIGGAVEQDGVAGGGEGVQGRGHASQHAVFIVDGGAGQPLHAVALLLPADDAVKVLLPGREVAKGRMLCPADNRFRNGGRGGEIHVRDPHGEVVKARFPGPGAKGGADVHGDGILSPAVQNGGKIVFHTGVPFLFYFRQRAAMQALGDTPRIFRKTRVK